MTEAGVERAGVSFGRGGEQDDFRAAGGGLKPRSRV